jgi:1,3-beta-galactosyl-N-acetylhexosamine phosphorylase
MKKNNGFTLPGESGYEKLTLELAERWGADVIRDSDGTTLSDEITDAGYKIYSTICIIRGHNEWAEKNPDKLQGSFLMTSPVTASKTALCIPLMKDFFEEQFWINETAESLKYWQVYDRTLEKEVPRKNWKYEAEEKAVILENIEPWHTYTVSFLVYRIWEEISMYNHVTNHWEKEHLMPVDPIYPQTQEYLLEWMDCWCREHPATNVVRFTSMFYNFVWIWGSNERNRNLFTDWASYDFTVSPYALDLFEKKYGYRLTAEDFINKGKLHVTHMPCEKTKRDWMEFVNDFVISYGKKLIDIVHDYGKEAYVFYDDSWVGIEPYGERFEEFGFDGIIKAVFSAFEARLASGVKVKTHELRLHPYLFPTGVDGSPSFLAEGNPKLEAQNIWREIRRAILRAPIERIGLGGYLHLVERKPEFVDYIEEISDEFRELKQLHAGDSPICLKPRVAVLHFWGKLRSWSLSGHFHETYMHDLIHINEALAGLPFAVCFINFEDVKTGALEAFDVVINGGDAGNAWSGGDAWKDAEIISKITEWVHGGGVFIGVGEPSAAEGYNTFFRMAHVLGVDKDTEAEICHGKWQFTVTKEEGLIPEGAYIRGERECHLTDAEGRVLMAEGSMPKIVMHNFGSGKGIYLASFERGPMNNRMLMNLILVGAGEPLKQHYITDNPYTECAYFPEKKKLVVINHADTQQSCHISTPEGDVTYVLKAYGVQFIESK